MIGVKPCPRCTIGTEIFQGSCIVCCTVNDAIAALLRELVTRNQLMRDALNSIVAADNEYMRTDQYAFEVTRIASEVVNKLKEAHL